MTEEALSQRLLDHDERITRHTEQLKTAFSQIAETRRLAESMHKLATSVELLAHEQKSVSDKVDALTGDVEEIKTKPARRWDSAVSLVLTAVITALVTLLLSRLGLK